MISSMQGMVWNEIEYGIERNRNFGMEYGRCQSDMELKISKMDWKTMFRTSIPIRYEISLVAFTEKYIQIVTTKNM